MGKREGGGKEGWGRGKEGGGGGGKREGGGEGGVRQREGGGKEGWGRGKEGEGGVGIETFYCTVEWSQCTSVHFSTLNRFLVCP